MAINYAPVKLDPTEIEDLRSQLGGAIVLPEDDNYDEVRLLANKMHDKRPAIIARCLGVSDVIAAVNFARKHALLIAVRGGGHNVAGSGSCDDGMMIDLSLMRGVDVNPETRRVRVQGGAMLRDLDRETAVHGLAVPVGVVSETGVAGLTLGGGLGWLRRKYGLSIDNLVSVDMVTADGKFLTASETQNSELFWGIRGGGGNFGVVTTFEFQAHPIGPEVMFTVAWYPAETGNEVLPKWFDFMSSAPEEVSSSALFWSIPPIPDLPEELHGKRIVIMTALHCGDADEGERVLQPLREFGEPLVDLSGKVPFAGAQAAFDPFFPKGGQFAYFKSKFLNRFDSEVIEQLLPKAINPPHPKVLIAIWHMGGAVARVPSDKTAYIGRTWPILFSVDCLWDEAEDSEACISYAREYLAEMDKFSPGGLYVNFAGLAEEGQDLWKDAYGDQYQRLVALKNKYDPTNFFSLNQNIKPTA